MNIMNSPKEYRLLERPMNSSPRRKTGAARLTIISICAIAALAAVANGQSQPGGDEQIIQTQCPVMTTRKIIPVSSIVYRGKKVYFCCDECKPAFEKNPQKYLHLLPQFAGVGAVADGEPVGREHVHDEHNGHGFSTAELIVPMGILTLTLVAVTVCLGFCRRVNPKLLKWHKRIGPVALLAGAAHAIIVLLSH